MTLPYTAISSIANQNKYRYGYNGQMKDDEWAGMGNHNSALYGEYDTRIGRRLNLDPKPAQGFSNYGVFSDNPMWFSDPFLDTPSTMEAALIAQDSYNDYEHRNKNLETDFGWVRQSNILARQKH